MPDRPVVPAHFQLLDAVPIPAYVSDPAGATVFVNRALIQSTGVSADELLGEGLAGLIHPDDREEALAISGGARLEGHSQTKKRELRLRHKTGAYHWYSLSTQPACVGEHGTYTVGTLSETHDAKGTESRVTALGVARVSFDGTRFLDVNDALCRITGYARDALLAQSRTSITHPHDVDLDRVPLRRMAAGELDTYTVEKRFMHQLGHAVWTRLTLTLVRDVQERPDYEICVVEDISERKASEAQVQANAATFTHLVQNNPFGIYVVDADFRLTLISRGAHNVFRNVRPLIGRDFAEVLRIIWTEPFASEAIARFRHTLATGEPYVSERTVERRSDIDFTEAYDWRIERLVLPDGRFGVVCFFYDLSERAAWEAKLQSSEAQLSAVLDALPVGVVIADASGRVVRDNTAHRELWNVPPDTESWKQYGEWVGWWPDTGKRVHANEWGMARALLNGETVRGELIEYQPFGNGTSTDTERRFFLNNAAPIRDAEGRVIGGVIAEQDVTAQIKAERAQRENAQRVQLALAAGAILGTWFWDLPTDRFTVDEAFAETFGLDPVLGREGLSLDQVIATVHPDDRPELIRAIERAIASGGPYAHQYRVRRRDGRYYWIEANGRVDHALDGTPLSFPGVLLDAEERRAAMATLREREERYRHAVRATNDVIWDWDLTTDDVAWSDAVHTRFGYAPHAVGAAGAWWKANIHPDDRDRVVSSMHDLIAGERDAWSDEYRFRRADGSYAEVYDRGTVLRDTHGRAVRMIGAMQDLTERRAAEAALRVSEERLRIAAEAAAIGTWDFDPIHSVLRWDARTKALFGVSPDADVTFETVFMPGVHPDDFARVEAAVRAALSPQGPGEYAIEHRTIGIEDGVERWIAAQGRAFFEEGRAVRFIGTVIDISERKRIEAQLRAMNDELERRVQERTADLMKANLELQRSNMELERFAYITSHDLTEPIRTVASFAGLLRQRYGASLDDRGRLFLDMTLKGTERMKAIVDDLLTYSRLSGDQVTLHRVNARVPLSEALARLERRLTETHAQVTWGELPVVLGDGPQLAQLFQNLIGNAVKFSRSGVTPAVHVRATREGEWWHFTVSDNGIGIDEKYLERIFVLFERLHTREAFEGTGLGLSICQKVVERHGGRIWATSNAGEGSAFHFTLRAAEEAPVQP